MQVTVDGTLLRWDTINRTSDGKVKLLYRHERIFSEPFMPAVKDVLDVGGWGMLATRMIEEGKNCIILDRFTADQYYAERVKALPHQVGDVLVPTSFPPETFDLITCFEVLEHVGQAKTRAADWVVIALRNMQGWLRTNGWLVGTVPIPGATHAADESGIEFIDKNRLCDSLDICGFTNIYVDPTVSIGLPGELWSSLYFRARKP